MFVADLAIEKRVVKVSGFNWSEATCQEKHSLISNRNLYSLKVLSYSYCP